MRRPAATPGAGWYRCARLALGVGLLARSGEAHPQDRPAASDSASRIALTPERALQRRQLSDIQFSPRGDLIALTVTEPVHGTEQNSDVWVYDVEGEATRRFTTSPMRDDTPRWSPDGQQLAFLSNRGEATQIYRLRLTGGDAEALTESETDITSFAWSPDGRTVAFLASEPKSVEEKEREKNKDDAVVVDRDEPLPRLWAIDIESRFVTQLTHDPWRISAYVWVPGRGDLIVAATNDPQPELLTERLYSLGSEDGAMTEVAAPAAPFGNLQLSPDGTTLAYVGTRRDGPVPHDLYLVPLASGLPRNVTDSAIDRPIQQYAWEPGGTLRVNVADGFDNLLYRVDGDGRAVALPRYPVQPGAFAVGPDRVAFVGQTATRAPELWIARPGAPPRPVTEFNTDWDQVALVEPDIIHYSSFDGTPIEAGLLVPGEVSAAPRLPLVVLVHGGPTGRWADRLDIWGQLLAARGVAVLSPNIRGSTGYGHDFLSRNRRDWGGGDFKDVMAGVDHLVGEGLADPARLGIGGWSYGGYMSAWAVTQTHRFKAAVSGAPMTDLAFEYGSETASINAYDTWFLGTPYENLDHFIERSPITHVKHATTPTLILCYENDVIDPVEQCQQFYRGLKRYGVETIYVRYPREGHGLREQQHRLDEMERVLEWFDRHLR